MVTPTNPASSASDDPVMWRERVDEPFSPGAIDHEQIAGHPHDLVLGAEGRCAETAGGGPQPESGRGGMAGTGDHVRSDALQHRAGGDVALGKIGERHDDSLPAPGITPRRGPVRRRRVRRTRSQARR